MNAGGAFGGNRGLKPVPPEKGVFPLDHLHECDLEKAAYIGCLKSNKYLSETCRHLSKKYLECRMERNLMAKQDISELGFKEAHGAVEVANGDSETYEKGEVGPIAASEVGRLHSMLLVRELLSEASLEETLVLLKAMPSSTLCFPWSLNEQYDVQLPTKLVVSCLNSGRLCVGHKVDCWNTQMTWENKAKVSLFS